MELGGISTSPVVMPWQTKFGGIKESRVNFNISKITENEYDIDWTNHHVRLSVQ